MNKEIQKKIFKPEVVTIVKIFIFLVVLFLVIFIIGNIFIHYTNKSKLGNVVIPDGFYYVGGKYNTGLVISDNKDDENKGNKKNGMENLKGNQFVWVPVDHVIANNEDELQTMLKEGKHPMALKNGDNYSGILYDFNKETKTFSRIEPTNDRNREPAILDDIIYGDNDKKISGSTTTLYQDSFNKMVEKVNKAGGFYISRYEMGNLVNASESSGKIVSKSGQTSVSNIFWSDMYKLAKNMYNSDVVSTEMIWGCQWDATLIWMSNNKKNIEKIYNSSSIGNYNGIISSTGATTSRMINNIYDMAGNVGEFTQEACFTCCRVVRGGSYSSKDEEKSMTNRNYSCGLGYTYNNVGLRIVMYI